jgi:hypothetical protein
VRSQRRRPPIVVEIDVENDEYNPTAWGRAAWQGVPLAFATIETVRKVLASEGHRALFAWGLRFDPQITIGEGRPDYILIEFENEIAAARQHGDSFGPHPHWFRLIDGQWVEDTTDAAWVEECIGLSLATFRNGFGKTPGWIHFGESWMDQACFNRAVDEGIRLVLTPEPGMKLDPKYLPGPRSREGRQRRSQSQMARHGQGRSARRSHDTRRGILGDLIASSRLFDKLRVNGKEKTVVVASLVKTLEVK